MSRDTTLVSLGRRFGGGWWPGLAFVTVVATIAHSAFSRMGFNPTDDGFILAYSRRLLEGEIPYRDFISIHAIGSPLLHLPFVAFGGDQTFWISRYFVWFEFALTAWAWTTVCARVIQPEMNQTTKFAYAGIGFMFCIHYFPVMAWNTMDGLMFVSLGLMLCTSDSRSQRDLGYLIIGLAYLCKQNFLPLAPVAIWMWGDVTRGRSWLAAALPGLLFIAYLLIASALPDAFTQLTARSELVDVGVLRYLWEYSFPWGVLFGLLFGRLAQGEGQPFASVALYAVLAAAAIALGEGRFLWTPSFGLLGVVLGAGLFLWHRGSDLPQHWRLALMAVMIGWCASISLGYNTPALAAGISVVFLLTLQHRTSVSPAFLMPVLTVCLIIVTAANYWQARHKHIYLDVQSAQLTEDTFDLFPGLQRIRTGPNTAVFLRDLERAVALAGDRPFAIIPDLAAYWVKAGARNTLPMDWPLGDILIRDELIERVTGTLAGGDRPQVVLVQKVRANALARGFIALPESQRYVVATYARTHLRKIGETEYFELYE